MKKLLFLSAVAALAFSTLANGQSAGASGAGSTTPKPLLGAKGTTLPSTCTIGELFYKTDAAAGSNVYGCTAANTWTAQAGGGGSGTVDVSGTPVTNQCATWVDEDTLQGVDCPSLIGTPAAGDFDYWSSATVKALAHPVASSFWIFNAGAPPEAYLGSTISTGSMITAISTTGVLSGTPTPTLGVTGTTTGTLTFGHLSGSGSGGVKISPANPSSTLYTQTLPARTSTITNTIASGTATLNPGALTTGTCSSAIDGGTATGVLTTDTINHAFNADLTATTGYSGVGTLVTIYKYPTADHVNFKVCNWTGSSITPTSVVINWSVTR